jgi:hypothetical protein
VRRIHLSTELPAAAAEAWQTLTDTPSWPAWGRLVTSATGAFDPGARWTITLRQTEEAKPREMRPRLISVRAPCELVFETEIARGWAVRIRHSFLIEPTGPHRSVLNQLFEVTGPLVVPLWKPVRRGIEQFGELGEDLATRLTDPNQGTHRPEPGGSW